MPQHVMHQKYLLKEQFMIFLWLAYDLVSLLLLHRHKIIKENTCFLGSLYVLFLKESIAIFEEKSFYNVFKIRLNRSIKYGQGPTKKLNNQQNLKYISFFGFLIELINKFSFTFFDNFFANDV